MASHALIQLRETQYLQPDKMEVLVHKMTSRTREFTKNNVQQEKMMALGKLSAGLAHELNNPAAAMARSARNAETVPTHR